MEWGRKLLSLNGWLFAGFGLGFALAPEPLAAIATGAAPATASAATDLRATYGGLALGLAFLFARCARTDAYVRLGVEGVLAVMAALAGARALGMAVDGPANAFMAVLLAAEAAMASLAVIVLKRVPSGAREPSANPAADGGQR